MMKRTTTILVLLLALAMTFLFAACGDEEDPTGPDSTESFVGFWIQSAFTINGTAVEQMSTMDLYEDSTGRFWIDEGDNIFAADFTWAFEGDSLISEVAGEAPFHAAYSLEGETVLSLSYEVDGESYEEEYVKWTGEADSHLVGDWEMSSQTRDGQTIDPDIVHLTINSDGTGVEVNPEGTFNFEWSTTGNYFSYLRPDTLGFVVTYAAGTNSFSVTQYREGALFVMGFTPYEIQEGLDPELIGTWVEEQVNNIQEGMLESVNSFLGDGTGSRVEYDESNEELLTFDFNWTTSNDTLYISDDTGAPLYTGVYSIDGLRLDLMEVDGEPEQAELYWKVTGDRPFEALGAWIQTEPAELPDGGGYEISVVIRLGASGDATIVSQGISPGEFEEWEDWEDVNDFTWSYSEDRLLLIDETGIGFAMQVVIDEDTATMTHHTYGTRVFQRFTGSAPEEMVGDWVVYDMMFNGEHEHFPGGLKIILNDDGTGDFMQVSYQRGEDDIEIEVYEAFSFQWRVYNDHFLMLEDNPERGDYMTYTLDGPTMVIHRTEFYWPDAAFVPQDVAFVKDVGDLDENLFGDWEKTSETINGEDSPDFDPITITFNDDGSGSDSDGETFNWTANGGYIIAHDESESGLYTLHMAFPYSINDGVLTLSEYDRNEMNELEYIVETFERP